MKAFSLGWLSKLWSLFGYPKYEVPYYHKDPKRDPDIDNHPLGVSSMRSKGFKVQGLDSGAYVKRSHPLRGKAERSNRDYRKPPTPKVCCMKTV